MHSQLCLLFVLGFGLFIGINATGEWNKINTDEERAELDEVVSQSIAELNRANPTHGLALPNGLQYKQQQIEVKKAKRQVCTQ